MSLFVDTRVYDFAALRARAATVGPLRLVVAGADSPEALGAAAAARREGIAEPILVGQRGLVARALRSLAAEAGKVARGSATPDPRAPPPLADVPLHSAPTPMEAATVAARLAGAGEAEVILKGNVRTDQLMRAVLDPENGVRSGRLMSDVLLYEDRLSGRPRLVGVTDGGVNPAPNADVLAAIVDNAVAVFRALGRPRPRVAILSATEVVSEAVASTVLAREVTQRFAAARDREVFGPLALDIALLESAARAKGIRSPVAGSADILVAASIETGNALGKAAKYLGGSLTAHVVVGARVPVLIPSRVESAEDKLVSIALGVVLAAAGPSG